MTGFDAVGSLREALRLSPDNAPLWRLLGRTLLDAQRAEEAERAARDALARFPSDQDLQLLLAEAFQRRGKASEALVVVEALARRDEAPPRAHLLHARLLLGRGEVECARSAYRRAVELDPECADPALAANVDAGGAEPVADREERAREAVREHGGGAEPPGELAPGGLAERPKIAFADVGGLDAVKDDIRMKIVAPLRHPELFRAYGRAAGGGLLLYGPPGCGKTLLARATAGEVEGAFLSIGLHDVLDMWLGQSEKNLHELFAYARAHTPCVLFFDEVDALGASRADMRRSGGRHLINQFLSEMDGAGASNEGVLVLAATNAPWHLDPAFRRPGRFDRVTFVPPPDAPARVSILRVLLAGKPAGMIDLDQVAKHTEGASGADLRGIVDQAVERRLREALRTGTPSPVTTKDLVECARAVRPTTAEWFAAARNYALYANQGGHYDDVLRYLKLR